MSANLSAPVPATATKAWRALQEHLTELGTRGVSLRRAFQDDPSRAQRLTFQAADLHVDLSKNLVTNKTLSLLTELAQEVGLPGRIEAMFQGAHINTTEDRAVLHTALRRPASDPLSVDGQDVTGDVHHVLDRMAEFAGRVRGGQWLGVTDKPVTHVVNIGIGGSDLGPAMVYEALAAYRSGPRARFISNVDPSDLADKTRDLDPETTLFIVASKTFGTLETLTNARLAKAWLLDGLKRRGAVSDDAASQAAAVAKHFVAVSTALDKVAAFGIDPTNAFGFWDWVGGRYSVDSAIGLSLMIALGPDQFRDFLGGFRAIDEHFRATPLERNVPVLMGLINCWYVNFWDYRSHAVLPYDQHLHRFPAYLQQLTMESNGKSVRWDGSPVDTNTGEIFWGEPGTNGQHAFFQLIHQGTQVVPADFIAFATPANPLTDGAQDVHQVLLANFVAQTAALAFGKTPEEVRAEGTPASLVTARTFKGNRPSTSIMAPALTPSVMGQLIALYEHITFTQGVIWGIDSFDQWGVQLGKVLTAQITPAFTGDKAALAQLDPSSRALVDYAVGARLR
ncbi:MAG: glucose-6-phosphate isomerase [Bifidobacteriaceae bacterium]|jgi:glucose-6-phosphate isomerase|nr:glucose-6-phosphate isomerase [Bifidobacteriaceae bacterium]